MNINQPPVRRVLLFLVVAITAALLSVAGFNYFTSKEVSFSLSKDTDSITIYDGNSVKTFDPLRKPPVITSINKSGTVRLRSGIYYIIPKGDKLNVTPIRVDVDNTTTTIDIQPYYSPSYLKSTYAIEIPQINLVLSGKFSQLINSYEVLTGTFYHFGDWYATTLKSKVLLSQNDDIQTYGVILKRDGMTWKIASAPSISFSYAQNSDVPRDIIDKVNQAVSSY